MCVSTWRLHCAHPVLVPALYAPKFGATVLFAANARNAHPHPSRPAVRLCHLVARPRHHAVRPRRLAAALGQASAVEAAVRPQALSGASFARQQRILCPAVGADFGYNRGLVFIRDLLL